jgi:hypothetical protein
LFVLVFRTLCASAEDHPMLYDLEKGEIVFYKKTAERLRFFKQFLLKPSVMIRVDYDVIETAVRGYLKTWYMHYDPTRAAMRTKKDPHIFIPAEVYYVQYSNL